MRRWDSDGVAREQQHPSGFDGLNRKQTHPDEMAWKTLIGHSAPGSAFSFCASGYTIGRFFIEFARGDADRVPTGWASLCLSGFPCYFLWGSGLEKLPVFFHTQDGPGACGGLWHSRCAWLR